MASTSSRTELNSIHDWENWSGAFKMRAGKKLWEIIRPGSTADFLEEPEFPPDLEIPAQVTGTQAQIAAANRRFETERQLYQQRLARYRELKKAYDTQEQRIDDVTKFVVDTVKSEYRLINCDAEDDIRTWYRNLEKSCKESEIQQEERALRKYDAHLSQRVKNPTEWLANWELVMAEAIKKNVAPALQISSWFNQLCAALAPLDEAYISALKVVKRKDMEEKTLDYRQVAAELKWHFESQRGRTGRIAKGSFGPTYAEANDDDLPEDQPSGHQRKKKTPKPSKRRRDTIITEREGSEPPQVICKACSQWGHTMARCFYVFPDKAPKHFKLNATMAAGVKARLETDSGLVEELKRLKKNKDQAPRIEETD
jgi:hypothetical protein